jgi:multidrug efflux pump subunit AcrA (membrane-fusion protein)
MPATNVQLPHNTNQLLTDEVEEVISYRPHWLVRKGNTVFLLVMLLLLGLTWVIKYPDILSAPTRLVALNPPKLIAARTEGKLLKISVHNEQQVKKGQHLGYMESTANYNQVIELKNWIHQTTVATQNYEYDFLLSHPLPGFSDLGELQANYQAFQNQMQITRQTLASGYFQKKKGALQKDLQYIARLKSNATQQKELQQEDQQLQQKEYEAYESLAKDKVIAPLELNQYKSKLIVKEQNLKQINAQITNSDINSHSKEKEILDLQKQVTDQQQEFHSALFELKSQVEKWIQQYVLSAPEDGKVLFVSSLQENQLITNGQELFYIQPQQSEFYAELMAGQQGLGKIKTGQKVMIKAESYPSDEFGYLYGTVSYISGIPNRRDSFLVKVDLPAGLRTNYNKTIFFRNGLVAKAEIITDNRKLFDRLTGQLKKLWAQ